MSKIKLEKMQFYAYHGCFAEEQLVEIGRAHV